jgi:hypothetical protein
VGRSCRSDIERGLRNTSPIHIERVAQGLSLTISELFRLAE